jgi:hypothetical protein
MHRRWRRIGKGKDEKKWEKCGREDEGEVVEGG